MPSDEQQPVEPKQKRVKIVSACSECRRKKTKCNGENPCSNCNKSSATCVYPTSHSDDKRNGPSKAALEAIEGRLKAIEDMLKTIIQSQFAVKEIDPIVINKLLNKDKSTLSSPPHQSMINANTSTTTTTTSPPPSNSSSSTPTNMNSTSSSSSSSYHHIYISPSPQPTSSHSITTSNPIMSTSPPPPSSSPLINNNNNSNNNNNTHRSSPPNSSSSSPSREVRLPSIHSLSVHSEQRDLPPLGSLQDYYYSSPSSNIPTPPQPSDVETHLHIERKRKR